MKLICYGDSNTFGYDPRSFFGDRYERSSRWPEILAANTGWEVINCGENGRRIPLNRVSFPTDADCIVVMLGTNDLLQGCGALETARRMEAFLLGVDKQKRILITPPVFVPGEWISGSALIDESRKLTQYYQRFACKAGIPFIDSNEWSIPITFDGVHFTEDGHKCFAKCLEKYIKAHE